MSQMEVHKGKAIPLNVSLDVFLNTHLELVRSDYLDEITTDPYEVFYNGLTCDYNSYVLINNLVYKLENTQLDEYGFAMATLNNDGSYDYFVNFYNGGCCLQEAIEEGMRNTA